MPQKATARMGRLAAVALTLGLSATMALGQEEAAPAPAPQPPAAPARPRREPKPLTGWEVGPQIDNIVPGDFYVDPPTLENLGFRWYIQGDSNRNASVVVQFRKKGDAEWRDAMPMHRVHHEIANQEFEPYRTGNLFAGSVLFLTPGTEYEVQFTMADPDGGAPAEPKLVTIATRPEPKAAPDARTIDATPEEGLLAAEARAEPGDIVLLHKGIYKGPMTLTKSGTAEKPIVYRAAGDGDVFLEGDGVEGGVNIIELGGANHIFFEGVTFRKAKRAINLEKGVPCEGLVVRRCKIHEVVWGVSSYSQNARNWYIADNEFVGINATWYPRPQKYMEPGHTAVNCYGQGNVVCYNRITRFSDGIAMANFGVPDKDLTKLPMCNDYYNNDISWAQDDTLETDYGCHNIRVYRNRLYNAHTAMSTQPFYGGPVYLIRNEGYGITSLCYKFNNHPVGMIAYNNTTCSPGQGVRTTLFWKNGHLRNNLFMGSARYAMEAGSPTPYSTMDYNGYRRNPPAEDGTARFIKWTGPKGEGRYKDLKEFFAGAGMEEHGIEVDYDLFVKSGPLELGKSWTPEEWDVQLVEGAKAIDAGVVIPQITDDFTGKAPDLGCFEVGKPKPHYGPRPM